MFNCLNKNIGTLTIEEAETLSQKSVAIVGLGGLGGRNAELLCRMGIGKLLLIDFDEFSSTNLNRQIFSNKETLGRKKVEIVKSELQKINGEAKIETQVVKLDKANANSLLFGVDAVIDALDNIQSRISLEEVLCDLKIPLVHGGVSGFCGEIAVVFPKENILKKLYAKKSENKNSSVLSCTCSVTSGIQSAKAVEILLDKFDKEGENFFLIDLEHMVFEKFKI